MVNTKSTQITAFDLLTGKKGNPLETGARLIRRCATVAVASADTNGSTYRFFRVHSSEDVAQLLLANDAVSSGLSFDFGLYDPAERGGAVVDADFFASAVSIVSARAAWTDITLEGVTTPGADITKTGQAIWQRLALTSDPGRWYDVVATANVVGSANGDVALMAYIATPN